MDIGTKYIVIAVLLIMIGFTGCSSPKKNSSNIKPNILIILSDQWRARSVGYANITDEVKTPNIDQLASQSANFKYAVSTEPVCTPFKASLLTGQRPLTHGVFMNDVRLDTSATTIAEILGRHGYQTGFIGKWHLDGQDRCAYIPPGPRRQGFQYWKALNCSHNYRHDPYFTDADSTMHFWEGFDAISQTRDAQRYIKDHAHNGTPFFLTLSWGLPHSPYHMAPQRFKDMYRAKKIDLEPNVPDKADPQATRRNDGHYHESVRKNIAGYYANISSLDAMVGKLRKTLKKEGVSKNTIILFTSDHGDLLGSHGYYAKQQPYDESARVPMLFYYKGKQGINRGTYDAMFSSQDIMPTLLGLAGVKAPDKIDGKNFSGYLRGETSPKDSVALLTCVQPFGQWSRSHGGKEYRGIRTPRYTYVRDLNGPWLFFDNKKDPYQMDNLAGQAGYDKIQKKLNKRLSQKLEQNGDEFRPGSYYVKKFNYPKLDSTGTVPYKSCREKLRSD